MPRALEPRDWPAHSWEEGSAKELSAPPGQPIVHLWARVQMVPVVGAKCGT